jgi:hypothetical protein
MKMVCVILSVIIVGILAFAGSVFAVTIPNPDTINFGDDLGDSGIFGHPDLSFAVEVHDLVGGGVFGFFFEGADVTDANNLFPIFDSDDNGPDVQMSFIDFIQGHVVDLDEGIIQDEYTGTGRIGFFLNPAYPGFDTIFTVPSLNTGGGDFVATFPVIGDIFGPIDSQFLDNDYLLVFAIEDIGTGDIVPIAVNFIAGVVPVVVPEPSTLILFGSCLACLGFYKRKRLKGNGSVYLTLYLKRGRMW